MVYMDKKKIGQRIKAIRLQMGKNQEAFGKLFTPQVSKGAVSRWESGDTIPSAKRLKKIAKLGDITVYHLLNGKDNRIKELMEEQGYSPALLADTIGKDQVIVQQYLTGHKQPSVEDWVSLAKLFNVTISYLKGETNDRNGIVVGTNYTFEDFASLQGITDNDIENLTENDKDKIAHIRLVFDLCLSYLTETIGQNNSSKEITTFGKKTINDINNIFAFWLLMFTQESSSNLQKIKTLSSINDISKKYINDLERLALKIGVLNKK